MALTITERYYLNFFKENAVGIVIPAVQTTTKALGIHRSSYYQYRDRLFLKGYLGKKGSYYVINKHASN